MMEGEGVEVACPATLVSAPSRQSLCSFQSLPENKKSYNKVAHIIRITANEGEQLSGQRVEQAAALTGSETSSN
jgi:hypothetical protein